MIEIRTFGPVTTPSPGSFSRADLEFYGVDHFKPSYVAEVFFNDPELTVDNADNSRSTYAGSFSIFGHGQCSGDAGHCDVHLHLRRFDDRPTHPLTRAFKRVVVTEALRRCVDSETITITVVAESDPEYGEPKGGQLLNFQGLQLATFDVPTPT